MRVAGSRCLVVGGVRRLGREIGLDLARGGGAVAVSSRRDSAALQGVVTALRDAGAPRAAAVTGDVAVPASARSLVDQAAAALGGLDALVFTASGPFTPTPPQDIDEASWDSSLDTIAKGFFFTACAARDRFLTPSISGERSGGRPSNGEARPDAGVIVAITDCMGLQPWANFAAHGAAKAAEIHLVKQLARAWTPEGVRVCGVAPGPVDLEDDERRDATVRAASRGDWQRLVRPQAVAAAVRFCLETQGVTGVNVVVDNGALLTS